MVSFPNCKINLGLYITGKRSDGFHDLETIFYPVDLTDALEIVSHKEAVESGLIFSLSGIEFQGNAADNICVKAYSLIKRNYPHLPSVKMHLHKSVPVGAGLGGGSADGAFTLKLLNLKFGLGLSASQLIDYALQLGSDCPFFIINKPVIASGRGELMKEINIDLSGYKLVLVNPGVHVNTGWAFGQLKTYSKNNQLDAITAKPVEQWKDVLRNDFEAPVFDHYPWFAGIKAQLYEIGALYASMSGSGSSFYGIFEKTAQPDLSGFSVDFFVKEAGFL